MTTLARVEMVIQDTNGNVLPGATVTVQQEISGLPVASIFSDRAGTVPKANPGTADASGVFYFHAAGGAYRVTAVSGSVTATARYVAVGTAQELDSDSLLTAAGGTVNGDLTINGVLTIVSNAILETLRRTENDTTERTVEEFQSGSGAGNKYNKRIVGTGANAVAEVREFIGSTELVRMTASLLKSFVDFEVGSNVHIDTDGYAELSEISTPANPAADKIRLYCRDIGGLSRLFYRDSAGNELQVGSAGGTWEEIGTQVVSGTPSNIDFTLTKTYSELVIVGHALSNSGTAANQLRVFVSDDALSTVESLTSGLTMTVATATGASNTATSPEVFRDTSLAAATADLAFYALWERCDKAGAAKVFSGWGASNTETVTTMCNGYTAAAVDAINRIRVNFASGNFDAGEITAYGRI